MFKFEKKAISSLAYPALTFHMSPLASSSSPAYIRTLNSGSYGTMCMTKYTPLSTMLHNVINGYSV